MSTNHFIFIIYNIFLAVGTKKKEKFMLNNLYSHFSKLKLAKKRFYHLTILSSYKLVFLDLLKCKTCKFVKMFWSK